jgi:hypothetical protein
VLDDDDVVSGFDKSMQDADQQPAGMRERDLDRADRLRSPDNSLSF